MPPPFLLPPASEILSRPFSLILFLFQPELTSLENREKKNHLKLFLSVRLLLQQKRVSVVEQERRCWEGGLLSKLGGNEGRVALPHLLPFEPVLVLYVCGYFRLCVLTFAPLQCNTQLKWGYMTAALMAVCESIFPSFLWGSEESLTCLWGGSPFFLLLWESARLYSPPLSSILLQKVTLLLPFFLSFFLSLSFPLSTSPPPLPEHDDADGKSSCSS